MRIHVRAWTHMQTRYIYEHSKQHRQSCKLTLGLSFKANGGKGTSGCHEVWSPGVCDWSIQWADTRPSCLGDGQLCDVQHTMCIVQKYMLPRLLTNNCMQPRLLTNNCMLPRLLTNNCMLPRLLTNNCMLPRLQTNNCVLPRLLINNCVLPRLLNNNCMLPSY